MEDDRPAPSPLSTIHTHNVAFEPRIACWPGIGCRSRAAALINASQTSAIDLPGIAIDSAKQAAERPTYATTASVAVVAADRGDRAHCHGGMPSVAACGKLFVHMA